MNLHFKETQYYWGDKFYILDDLNQRKYFVQNQIIFWNKKWEICDLNKNVLVTIKKEPKSLLKKKYYIFINEQKVAAITKEISLLPKYTFDGLDWEMNGLMLHEYEMLQNGQEVLSFHTEITNWGSRPILKIADPANELLALAVVTTISYVMNAREDNTSENFYDFIVSISRKAPSHAYTGEERGWQQS